MERVGYAASHKLLAAEYRTLLYRSVFHMATSGCRVEIQGVRFKVRDVGNCIEVRWVRGSAYLRWAKIIRLSGVSTKAPEKSNDHDRKAKHLPT